MVLHRLLLHTLRRRATHPTTTLPIRTLAFSSAEEAAAERRRRKRRLRIEPPLHALRRDPSSPRPPPDPNARPLPDTTASLTGPRLNLHNRVQSLIRASDLNNASSVARHAVFSRVRPTVFTCNAIIAAMYRGKRYNEAVSLFHFFFNQSNIVPNVVSYNFLIVSHCENTNVDLALEVYRLILSDAPFSPSSVTYRHLTKGLIHSGRIHESVDLLREMLGKGLGADSLVFNNLIKGFLDLGDFDKANEFFDELKERCLVYDGVVNATFMDWFFNQERGKEAMESYRSLLDRQFKMTPATCNVLLEVLIRHGKKKDASELFDSMLDNHTPPNFQAVNSDTFNIMVNECFKEGKFEEAVCVFKKVGTKMGSRPFAMDVAGYTNIIVRFAEKEMTSEAEKFFAELQSKSLSPDVTGYRTLIDAYFKEERIDDALQLFNRMVDANLRVIPEYANKWFTELIQNNKAVECSSVLTKMGEREPKPDASTYEIVVKGLCGVGAFDATVDIVGQSMRYGVGVTPSLRDFLVEVFDKEGKKEEMETILDERRQGYWQQPRPQPTGPPRSVGLGELAQQAGSTVFRSPTGFPGQASPTGHLFPAAPTGYPRPVVGPGGYPQNPVGASGHSVQSGPIGYQNSVSPTEDTGSSRHTGYSGSFGHGGYPEARHTGFSGQSGSIGYQNSVPPTGGTSSSRHTGYSGSTGHGGFPDQARHGGFSGQSGPTIYQNSVSQTGYTSSSGPAGYSGPVRQGGYSGQTSSAGYPDQAGPTHFYGQSGSTVHPGSVARTGYMGYPGSAERPGFQGQERHAAFPGSRGDTGYPELSGPDPEEQRGYSGPIHPSSG